MLLSPFCSWESMFFVCAGILFLPAMCRFADGDEGFYIYAVRLVREGQVPYRDFFYTQSPLLPYAFGLFPPEWPVPRMLSLLLLSVLCVALNQRVRDRTIGVGWAGAASILFGCSVLVFMWMTVVKTYGLATLLLFLGCLTADPPHRRAGVPRLIIAGILVALSGGVRSLMLAAFPAFVLHAFLAEPGRRVRGAAAVSLGLAIGLAPTLYFAWLAPENFWFCNFGYHMLRPGSPDITPLSQKLEAAASLFGLREGSAASGAQFGALFAANIWALVYAIRTGARPSLGLLIVPFLFGIHWIPTPAYPQYFCVLVPFMILNAVEFFPKRIEAAVRSQSIRPGRAERLLVVALVAYALLAPPDYYRLIAGGQGMPRWGASAPDRFWRFNAFISIREKIDSLLPGSEPVLVFWPGYLVDSRHPTFPGTENQFALEIAPQLSADERKRLHIASREDIEAAIRERSIPLVVLGNWVGDWRSSWKDPMARLLRESGYKQVFYGWGAGFYMRTEDDLGKEPAAGAADSGVK